MMIIKMGSRLRELRMRVGATQEEFASFLGITPQAVSKWERDEGLPDISFLSEIATYYNVSVDYILGIDKEDHENYNKMLKAKDRELLKHGEHDKRERLWREAARNMTHNTEVLNALCFALRRSDINKNADEIIALSHEVLSNTTVSGEYFAAINHLCRAFAAKGDINMAKKYAALAGRYVGTENQLMIQILEGENAAAFCQWNIETLMDLIATNAHVMLVKGKFSISERIAVCDTIINLYKCILGDCYGFYHCRIADWNIDKAEACMDLNDDKAVIMCIERAIMHAKKFDRINEVKYTSVLMNRQEYKKDTQYQMVKRIDNRIRSGVLKKFANEIQTML